MKLKNKTVFFIISVIISFIILCFFVTGYYSIDTARIYSQGYIDYAIKVAYIKDGRWISAIIYVIVGLINPSIETMYIVNIILAIIILSFSVIQIYDIIEKCKKLEKTKSKIIAFLLSYTYIFNFLIVDVLKFIDSFVISISILIFIIAIKKIIFEKKKRLGLLLTIFGVICYQGTIPVYIATAILVTLLENKRINKEYFKKILPCAISIIIAAIISLIIINIVPMITGMTKTDRMNGIDYIENIRKNLMVMNETILYSFYMFPQYVWISIGMFTIIISIIYGIKKKNMNYPINILFIFMMYIFSSLVMFPIQPFNNAPRVALVLGESISAMYIYSYCTNFERQKMNLYEKTILIMIIIYFIVTIISIMKSTYQYKLGNIIDEQFSEKIENEIVNLEKQGITINKIGIKYTGNGKNIQKYSRLVRNQSMYMMGLYTVILNEFYTGRTLSSVQDFTEQLEQEYFENSSKEEVQFQNIGNVLYILIDL